jgi:hypothetical protein
MAIFNVNFVIYLTDFQIFCLDSYLKPHLPCLGRGDEK